MVPSEQVIPGDVVMPSAGSMIPVDGVVLETNNFFVNQAVLTGEAFPVEKTPGTVPAKASLVALYVLVTEIAKKLFYSRVENQTA